MRITIDDIRKSKVWDLNKHRLEIPKKPKYRNTKTEINGIRFDSKKEAAYYKSLLLLQKAGKIGLIERQVSYELIPANETERKCCYIADFRFVNASGETIVCDVKSEITRKLPVYILKRKLMLQVHGVRVVEV